MPEIFGYVNAARFAVAKKLPWNERFQVNFKYLHETRESADKEALRLSEKHDRKFYVVEILAVTSGQEFKEKKAAVIAA